MPSGVFKRTDEYREKLSESLTGKKKTEEHKNKIRISMIGKNKNSGEKNGAWKGYKAGKSAIHKWLLREKGKPCVCEHCKITIALGASRIEWANFDHSYKRVAEDYIGLCPSCHKKYDNKFNRKNNE